MDCQFDTFLKHLILLGKVKQTRFYPEALSFSSSVSSDVVGSSALLWDFFFFAALFTFAKTVFLILELKWRYKSNCTPPRQNIEPG